MSESKIDRALRQAFITAFPSDIPIIWENRSETPPANAVWAQVFTMPADRYVATQGEGGMDEMVGIFQIDVNVPKGSGVNKARDLSDLLVSYFVAGLRLEYDGQLVTIRRAVPSPFRGAAGSTVATKTVTVYWSAWIQRRGI